MSQTSVVTVSVTRSLSARARRMYEARKKQNSADTLCCLLIGLLVIGLVVAIFITKHFGDDSHENLEEANVRLMTHPDFQALLETHVMGDVYLVDEDNKIGVINDKSDHGHSFGLKEANVVCKQYGYPMGAAAFTKDTFFQTMLQADYTIEDLHCEGTEDSLHDCEYSINENEEEGVLLVMEFIGISGVVCKSGGKSQPSSEYYQFINCL